MSYSQNDEEKYILEACATATRKQVLDIGAWDPEDKSNSRALIESGWGAVLVEPSPGPALKLMKFYRDRQDVHVIPAAVGSVDHLLEFRISDDATSTNVKANAERWAGTFFGRLWVSAVKFKTIIEQFGAFDFVSIDAEGTSVDILHDVLATEMYPRCICVEHDGRIHEVLNAAAAKSYRVTHSNQENLVLVRGE